jgi:hypothetical protein
MVHTYIHALLSTQRDGCLKFTLLSRAQLNLASATVAGANLTSNTAVTDSGGMHAEGTELLSLSAIDFLNSTVTEGGSASAAL